MCETDDAAVREHDDDQHDDHQEDEAADRAHDLRAFRFGSDRPFLVLPDEGRDEPAPHSEAGG